jgi:hypothetical protein
VRFSPDIQIIAPLNVLKKSDRFNPDLRDCVKRNTQQAMAAGGAKALVSIELAQHS